MSELLRKLKEPSTWSGIAVVVGLVGITVTPEMQKEFVTLMGAVYGLIQIFWKKDSQSM